MRLLLNLPKAYWEAEEEAAKKAKRKLEERVLKRWTRLVHGLRIRQRLQEQYAKEPQSGDPHWLDTQPVTSKDNETEEVSPPGNTGPLLLKVLLAYPRGRRVPHCR